MKNSAERIQFISEYISSYENKIKELNRQGLFDAAKLFELFASKVGELYLGLSKPLKNLNVETNNFPCVDLFSEDGNTFFQVSTCQNIPCKIEKTLKTIEKSTNGIIKSIKRVIFIVLSNESVDKVKDLTIGKVSFNKNRDLITTGNIIDKAKCDLEFQKKLYLLLKEEDEYYKNNFKMYEEAISYDSKVILDDIDGLINGKYYIDLSEQISKIQSENKRFMIISGDAGCGKSVLCKKLLESKKNVLCARAEKLVEKSNVNEIWDFNIEDVLCLVNEDVYIYIDALEFIADNRNKLDLLDSLLLRLQKLENCHFLCSCRSSDLGSFIRIISKYDIAEHKISPITINKIIDISKEFPSLLKIINNAKYNSLLSTPFYINFLTKINDFDSINDESQLRREIWNDVICQNNETIKPIIESIALERATNFILYSNASKYDKNTIDKLVSGGVLIKNENGIRLKYDIFEDICFEQYIDSIFDESKGNYLLFFEKLENIGRCIYRRYQIWVENKLFARNDREKFLYNLVSTNSISSLWKQQTIIGIIKSSYCQNFFDEYSLEIVDNNLLQGFIDVTNIYGFEISKISFNREAFILKNKGAGRESLIKIIYDNEIYKNDLKNEDGIKKLIFDYTNSLSNNNVSKYSFEILKYYVDKSLNNNYSYDLISKEVEAIYKLYEVSDQWIRRFFKDIKSFLSEGKSGKVEFAFDSIKGILSLNCLCLLKKYSTEILDFYDLYYTVEIEDKNSFYNYYHDDLKHNRLFGLNDNAESYKHESFNANPKLCNIISVLLRTHFWPTFEWYLEFLNKAINSFKTKRSINTYSIYLSKDCIREYLGISDMWMTGECQNNMPTLLSDMTYIVKRVIIDLIKSLKDKNAFSNSLKQMIYEKSNNIIGLSIVSNIGLTFSKELPGYCLELVSSLELVLADLNRYGLTLTQNNPARKITEGERTKKAVLPVIFTDKYNDINPNNELRHYAFHSQLCYPELRDKFYEIFDYLYSLVKNDEEHAILFLQLQQMDIRNASFNEIDSNTYLIEAKVDGAAKKLCDEKDDSIKKYSKLVEQIARVNESIENKTVSIEEIDELIKARSEYDVVPLSIHFNNSLIRSISFALDELDISCEKRDEYCSLWIKYAHRQMNNESVFIDADLYYILFNQLNENINDSNKNEIKKIILDLLIGRDNNDFTLYQIYTVANQFILNNPKYSRIFLNTIFLLASDEMQHQYYNYKYLCKYHKKPSKKFIPNMQPKLRGADYYIAQDGRKQYDSKRGEIINDYLFEECECTISDINVDHYDIEIISHAFSCGLNACDEFDRYFIRNYINKLIDIYHKNKYNTRNIIGYYVIVEVEDFFKRNLLNVDNYSCVLELLFNEVDFNKFTSNTVDFYLTILASMTAYYFASYDSKENRKHVEKVIRLMEKYINQIPIEWIKNELIRALFLGFDKFGTRSDWSMSNANYGYSDKMFLNDIFSKYGHIHFSELLVVIQHLQYKKLLPEILISIHKSFEKYFILSSKRNDELKKIIEFINQIMYYSFVNFEREIKDKDELINAFEGILSILIELKDEKSAVLLDEFRVH